MKKYLAAFLALCMSCSLWGCAASDDPEGTVSQGADFVATIQEVYQNSVLVEPVEGEDELRSSDQITFGTQELPDIGAEVGDQVRIFYNGEIMESYPAQIRATGWEMVKKTEPQQLQPYTGAWIDRETAETMSGDFSNDMVITEIYADCFFATPVIPLPFATAKINGSISEEWCVGDQVLVHYENYAYADGKIEGDLLDIRESTFMVEPGVAYKPVIYLYPEQEMAVSVKLRLDGKLLCTYPAYGNGWKVTASPDGTLTDFRGQTYNYLYWEGQLNTQWDMTEGFCVKGEDTAAFLEETLETLGLNRREANEFIVYWLPLMEQNPYNLIAFQTEAYTDAAALEVSPAPDTLIRVFMTWQASETYVGIPAQVLTYTQRTGFTVIEWGGTEVK